MFTHKWIDGVPDKCYRLYSERHLMDEIQVKLPDTRGVVS